MRTVEFSKKELVLSAIKEAQEETTTSPNFQDLHWGCHINLLQLVLKYTIVKTDSIRKCFDKLVVISKALKRINDTIIGTLNISLPIEIRWSSYALFLLNFLEKYENIKTIIMKYKKLFSEIQDKDENPILPDFLFLKKMSMILTSIIKICRRMEEKNFYMGYFYNWKSRYLSKLKKL